MIIMQWEKQKLWLTTAKITAAILSMARGKNAQLTIRGSLEATDESQNNVQQTIHGSSWERSQSRNIKQENISSSLGETSPDQYISALYPQLFKMAKTSQQDTHNYIQALIRGAAEVYK